MAKKKAVPKRNPASSKNRASAVAAIDDMMREANIPAGGARFETPRGQRVAKSELVDSQGRMKSGRIVPRQAAGGGQAAVISFSGGMFH